MSRNKVSVSRAPFATVGKTGNCPSCGWSPKDGGLHGSRGIKLALRIHCYREHGFRLLLGSRQCLPAAPSLPIDLDAEFSAHLWVIDTALRHWDSIPRDEARQEARQGLLSAILMWDRKKLASFCAFAVPIIRRNVAGAEVAACPRPPVGKPLRVMLPQPYNPASVPLVTPKELSDAMRCLSDRQRLVLDALFSESPMTLVEIGESIGLVSESVRQIKLKALARLRSELTDKEPLARPRLRIQPESCPVPTVEMVEMGQEAPPPPAARNRTPRPPKRRRRAATAPPQPGLFTVLLGEDRTKMDGFGALHRVASDGTVFSDRRMAARLAQNLTSWISRQVGDRDPKTDKVQVVDATGMEGQIVDSLPPIRQGMSITAEAVRAELLTHGPMTIRQIAMRLIVREGYMRIRHPDLDPRDVDGVVVSIRSAMKRAGMRRICKSCPCVYEVEPTLWD